VDIRKAIMAAVLIFVSTTAPVLGWGPGESLSLKGIKEMFVVVESINPEAVKDGLTEKQIQTDVEPRLRMARIKVNRNEPLYILAVVVHIALLPNTKIYYYSVEVQLRQYVSLVRNSEVLIAVTWETSSIGIVHRDTMPDVVRGHVKDMVDVFINDYLSVNPIQAPIPKPKKQL
jgi:hypothetical protein